MLNRLMITVLALGVSFPAFRAGAEVVVFQLEADQSVVTLSGLLAGRQAEEQDGGSLTTRFEGTLVADLQTATIEFVGGSALDARTNGVWEPLPGGDPGSAPADFGGRVSLGLLGSAIAAVRNTLLDLESPTLPLAAGQFDGSALAFLFPTNGPTRLDYRVTALLGPPSAESVPLEGYATNRVAAGASLLQQGNQEVLTIPLDAEFVFGLLNPNDSSLFVKGQLVATRSVSMVGILVRVRRTGASVTLEWDARGTATFTVWETSDFGSWDPVATELGPDGDVVTWEVSPERTGRYFRVMQE